MADIAQRFDEVLRNLAGQAGSLEALLRVFFSFLHRNTDFYVTFDPATTAKAGMGFPSGKAEQLLLRAFRSFPYKPYGGGADEQQRQRSSTGGGQGTATASSARSPPTAPPSGSISRKKEAPSPVARSTGTSGQAAPVAKAKAAPKSPTASASASPPAPPAAAGGGAPHSPAPQPNRTAAGDMRVRYTQDGKQVPIGNGGVTPRYYWTQTVNEATVYVDVPPGTRSKDVECVIQPSRLKLRVRGAGAATGGACRAAGEGGGALGRDSKGEKRDGDLIFDGELPSVVSREDSMWSLNDGTTVVISFEKTTKSWWKSVVEGDPEIDTSKVDSTTKISEYDGETQGAIRKIMFDQRQKSLGLPTSDQLNADAVLERAKGLPGSPFLPGGDLFDGGVGGAAGGSGVGT
eukprot:g12722.t1